jgi:hypothetical protein
MKLTLRSNDTYLALGGLYDAKQTKSSSETLTIIIATGQTRKRYRMPVKVSYLLKILDAVQ